MTVLDTFLSFAKALPADRLQGVEAALAEIMASYSKDNDFTASELVELDRRRAVANPRFAAPDDISKLLGKPFSK